MTTSEMSNLMFNSIRMRMTLHLDFVLFPIRLTEFSRRLTNKGFEIIAPPAPRAPPGTHLEFAGDLAKKGRSFVDINPDRQILGIKGVNFEEMEQVYEELKEIIQEEMGINFEQRVRFYELTGEYIIKSDKRAIDSIANLFTQDDFLNKCSSVLNSEVSVFTIRLVSKGQIPNQEEWFDVSIWPVILEPSLFNISVVFRSEDESKVLSFARGSELKLLELIRLIQD